MITENNTQVNIILHSYYFKDLLKNGQNYLSPSDIFLFYFSFLNRIMCQKMQNLEGKTCDQLNS